MSSLGVDHAVEVGVRGGEDGRQLALGDARGRRRDAVHGARHAQVLLRNTKRRVPGIRIGRLGVGETRA